MSSILEGVKVLDFGRYIAGPFVAVLIPPYARNV